MGLLPPTTMLMIPEDPEDGPQILGETVQIGGKPIGRPIRQIIMRMGDGSRVPIAVPRGWKVAQLRQALEERGVGEGATLQSVYVPDESEDPNSTADDGIRRLLTDVFGAFQATVRQGLAEQATPPRPISIESNLTKLYFRGLAKTAFHYLLWASPVVSGHEREFEDVRQFIRHGVGDVRQFVTPGQRSFIPQIADGWRPKQVSHFLAAAIDSNVASGALHFFVATTQTMSPAFTINFGRSPLRTIAWASYCHQAKYFDSEQEGHDGELEAIEVIRRFIIPP